MATPSTPQQTRSVSQTTALLAIGFACVFPSMVTWVYFVWLQDHAANVQQTSYSIGKLIQFLFPLVWIYGVDRSFVKRKTPEMLATQVDQHPADHSNLTKRNAWLSTELIIGIGFGLLVVASMLVVYYGFLASSEVGGALVDAVQNKTSGLGIDTPIKFLGLGIFYALVHSFLEEYYWRWFVFGYLKQHSSFLIALVISSLGFMAHHVILLSVYFGWDSPMTYVCSAGVAIGGVFWAWLYQRAGSLRSAWVSHLVVDAGIFLLGYLMIRDTF